MKKTNNKPTRQELESQIAELKKQNKILRLHTSFQSEEEKGSNFKITLPLTISK